MSKPSNNNINWNEFSAYLRNDNNNGERLAEYLRKRRGVSTRRASDAGVNVMNQMEKVNKANAQQIDHTSAAHALACRKRSVSAVPKFLTFSAAEGTKSMPKNIAGDLADIDIAKKVDKLLTRCYTAARTFPNKRKTTASQTVKARTPLRRKVPTSDQLRRYSLLRLSEINHRQRNLLNEFDTAAANNDTNAIEMQKADLSGNTSTLLTQPAKMQCGTFDNANAAVESATDRKLMCLDEKVVCQAAKTPEKRNALETFQKMNVVSGNQTKSGKESTCLATTSNMEQELGLSRLKAEVKSPPRVTTRKQHSLSTPRGVLPLNLASRDNPVITCSRNLFGRPYSTYQRALNFRHRNNKPIVNHNIPLNKAPCTPINGEKFAAELKAQLARRKNNKILDLRKRRSLDKTSGISGGGGSNSAASKESNKLEQMKQLETPETKQAANFRHDNASVAIQELLPKAAVDETNKADTSSKTELRQPNIQPIVEMPRSSARLVSQIMPETLSKPTTCNNSKNADNVKKSLQPSNSSKHLRSAEVRLHRITDTSKSINASSNLRRSKRGHIPRKNTWSYCNNDPTPLFQVLFQQVMQKKLKEKERKEARFSEKLFKSSPLATSTPKKNMQKKQRKEGSQIFGKAS